jgi:hypothetical protein
LGADTRKHHITRAYVLTHGLQDIDMVGYQYQRPARGLRDQLRQATLQGLVLCFGTIGCVEKRSQAWLYGDGAVAQPFGGLLTAAPHTAEHHRVVDALVTQPLPGTLRLALALGIENALRLATI